MKTVDKDEDFGLYFHKGAVIYVKHNSMLEPVLCIIDGIEDKNITFSAPEIFNQSGILKGDYLFCQLIKDDYEYVGYGQVIDIDIKSPVRVVLDIDKLSKYKNNRAFSRYSVNLQSNLYSIAFEDGRYAIIKNISILGAAVISKEEIEKGTEVRVEANTMINNEVIEFKAKVVRSIKTETHYEYGFEIIEISDLSKNALEKLLFTLTNNEEELVQNLMISTSHKFQTEG